MDAEAVNRACGLARKRLLGPVSRLDEHGSPAEHALWMLDRIPEFMAAGRREKAMRWLGFVQGALWAWNYATIDEMKDDNREAAQ